MKTTKKKFKIKKTFSYFLLFLKEIHQVKKKNRNVYDARKSLPNVYKTVLGWKWKLSKLTTTKSLPIETIRFWHVYKSVYSLSIYFFVFILAVFFFSVSLSLSLSLCSHEPHVIFQVYFRCWIYEFQIQMEIQLNREQWGCSCNAFDLCCLSTLPKPCGQRNEFNTQFFSLQNMSFYLIFTNLNQPLLFKIT